jgi:hypothetical protein
MDLQVASIIIAIFALLVSLGTLCVSFYSTYQDRPRLRIATLFLEASEFGPNRVVVTLVNTGRRPIILRLVGGTTSEEHWSGSFIDFDKGGRRLAEHERHEITLEKEDTIGFNPEGDDLNYVRLWIEDSLGNRHHIPNSESLIDKLRA